MHPPDEIPASNAPTPAPPATPGPESDASDLSAESGDFLIAGFGASAGAFEAILEILKRIPADSNLAIVLVQHLDPNHESALVDLLRRVASLPVGWATNGQAVEPGNVYVAPPKTRLAIKQGVLLVRDPGTSATPIPG